MNTAIPVIDIEPALQNFLAIASIRSPISEWQKASVQDLVESAFSVLHYVPSARDAVFEYFGLLVQECVLNFLLQLENGVADDISNVEEAVEKFACKIKNLLQEDHQKWITKVYDWSLDLLGQVSRRCSGKKVVPKADMLNELLQLYTSCRASSIVLDVLDECALSIMHSNPERCVSSMLELSAKYSFYFDWILTFVGQRHPDAICSELLAYGLRQFSAHVNELGHSGGGKQSSLSSTAGSSGGISGKQQALIASYRQQLHQLATILRHLAQHATLKLNAALMKVVVAGLSEKATLKAKMGIPFLLKLFEFSPEIFEIVAKDLAKLACNDAIVKSRKILITIPLQPLFGNASLSEIIFGIIRKLKESTLCLVLDKIIELAYQSTAIIGEQRSLIEPVAGQLRDLLDGLVDHLQRQVHQQVCFSNDDLPVLQRVFLHLNETLPELHSSNVDKTLFTFRLLCAVAWMRGCETTSTILSFVLCRSRDELQLALFVSFCNVLLPYHTNAVEIMLAKLSIESNHWSTSLDQCRCIQNLYKILKESCAVAAGATNEWWKQHLMAVSSEQYVSLCTWLLSQALIDLTKTSLSVKVCQLLIAPKQIQIPDCFKLLKRSLAVFFLCQSTIIAENELHQQGRSELNDWSVMLEICDWINYLLQHQPHCKPMVISILTKRLFNFDGKSGFASDSDGNAIINRMSKLPVETSLMQCNKNVINKTASALVHSGVIGTGAKWSKKDRQVIGSVEESSAELMTVHLLQLCCLNSSNALDMSYCRVLINALNEQICPDAIAQCAEWLSWTQMKQDVERALQVFRRVQQKPVLWTVLHFMADAYPVLWFASPILRGLFSYALHQCESSAGFTQPPASQVILLVEQLFNLLKKAQMLPDEFESLPQALPKITGYEASILLADLWRYFQDAMQDMPLIERYFQQICMNDDDAINVRPHQLNPDAYLQNFYLIIQANIETLGELIPSTLFVNS